ncbi:hypothetical protein ACSBR2_009765 [Camellia fascicularis]
MAPTTTTTTVTEASTSTAVKNQQQRHPKARRVCFSFAAYAKKVIEHLESCNVPIAEGLTDDEFSAVESQFNFTFPPDLRSILQEGLPVGPGFPNWRSSSSQQLEILTNLPILSLCKQVSIHNFWAHSWGDQPNDTNEAVQLAKRFLKNKSPNLVPIYRHCYIPSSPNLAGNPIFYVHGADVRLASFDVAGFFHRVDFPVWAATEPRRIEFWTEMVERAAPPLWWTGDLVGCMEDVCWRLRDGGWKEDEVREMMMMDGGDERDRMVSRDLEGVVCHVRVLSLRLLRAGWSAEDVVDSLGYRVENDVESWLDFQHTKSCLLEAI